VGTSVQRLLAFGGGGTGECTDSTIPSNCSVQFGSCSVLAGSEHQERCKAPLVQRSKTAPQHCVHAFTRTGFVTVFLVRKQTTPTESVFQYRTIIKPIWIYGIELWGCASKSLIAKMQRSQSKILRMITNTSWYVTNQILHDDLKVPFNRDVIQERSINHHDKLGNLTNTILQPLLEQQQRRRLKKLWPADLIDS
jgi:hypothetical protein